MNLYEKISATLRDQGVESVEVIPLITNNTEYVVVKLCSPEEVCGVFCTLGDMLWEYGTEGDIRVFTKKEENEVWITEIFEEE